MTAKLVIIDRKFPNFIIARVLFFSARGSSLLLLWIQEEFTPASSALNNALKFTHASVACEGSFGNKVYKDSVLFGSAKLHSLYFFSSGFVADVVVSEVGSISFVVFGVVLAAADFVVVAVAVIHAAGVELVDVDSISDTVTDVADVVAVVMDDVVVDVAAVETEVEVIGW